MAKVAILLRHKVQGDLGEWVEVAYPISIHLSDEVDVDGQLTAKAEQLGGKCLSGHAGAGVRDISFGFGDNTKSARKLAEWVSTFFDQLGLSDLDVEFKEKEG